MRRALPGFVAVLLALAVGVAAPWASAQVLSRLRRPSVPAQKGRFEIDAILSDEYQRLAEMQVELALLGDIATFPYDFAARAKGKTMELHGNVPNEMVHQRAMEVARSNTFLRGIDALTIQGNLSVRSSLRSPSIVQQEGIELLQKELGAAAKQVSLEARPNGVVVLTGRIDCVESRLEISRLFRRLPGCTAVINELLVEPISLHGTPMVRVTRNNMMLVPPSALGQESKLPPASVAAIANAKAPAVDQGPVIPPQPRQAPSPVSLHSSSLEVRDGELRLPSAVARTQSNSPAHPPEKVGDGWEAFAPSKLPVKWGRPNESLETQAKDLEAGNQQSQPLSRPAKLAWTPQSDHPQNESPASTRMVGRQANTKNAQMSTMTRKSDRTGSGTRLKSVSAREATEEVLTWQRPSGSEESEPPSSAPAKEEKHDSVKLPPPPPRASSPAASIAAPRVASDRPAQTPPLRPSGAVAPSAGPHSANDQLALSQPPPPVPTVTPVQSSRRWPAAYVSGPVPSKGRTGGISSEDASPPPKPAPAVIATPPLKPAPAVIAAARPLASAELQRQIKSICGRQAREVVAAVQKDGTVLVRVKVANRSIEDQLSRKILALPEMSSPKVRLMMEIEP